MTVTLQGLIVALLTTLLLGFALGYAYLQNRWQRQSVALKESQRRVRELEQSHELRLRETQDRLRAEYEAEITATIEHYQDQLSRKTLDLEQSYETRIQVLQQGAPEPADFQPALVAGNGGYRLGSLVPGRPYALGESTEPMPLPSEAPLSQPELMRLKRQYEAKLKEAAQKLQKAYERQLAQNAKNLRLDLQAEYEQRLAARLQVKEQELAELKADIERLERDRVTPVVEATFPPAHGVLPPLSADAMAADFAPNTPSQIMGIGDDTTVTLSPAQKPLNSQRPPSPQYIQEEIEARIQTVAEQMRQDYERQLATQLDAHQTQVSSRLQELEAEYRQRLAALAAAPPSANVAETTERGAAIKADLPADLTELAGTSPREGTGSLWDLAGTSPREGIPEDHGAAIADLDALPPMGFIDEGDLEAEEREDDDDFGPLDLSDISQLT